MLDQTAFLFSFPFPYLNIDIAILVIVSTNRAIAIIVTRTFLKVRKPDVDRSQVITDGPCANGNSLGTLGVQYRIICRGPGRCKEHR